MTSGGKSDKPGKENFMSGQPRIKVMAIEERDGMPWFRELRGTDGALYRIYYRRGEMYGFNIETEELIFERKEGGPDGGMTLDSDLLERVADVFEFVDDAEAHECIECFEKYPVVHVPDICDQCGFPTQTWAVKSVTPTNYEKLPFPLRVRCSTRDYWPNRTKNWHPNDALEELGRALLVGGWIIQNDRGQECHVVVTEKLLVSVLSERDENGNAVGTLTDATSLKSGEASSLRPAELVKFFRFMPCFYFPEKLCPTCYLYVDFFEASCPECGVEVL